MQLKHISCYRYQPYTCSYMHIMASTLRNSGLIICQINYVIKRYHSIMVRCYFPSGDHLRRAQLLLPGQRYQFRHDVYVWTMPSCHMSLPAIQCSTSTITACLYCYASDYSYVVNNEVDNMLSKVRSTKSLKLQFTSHF